MRADSPEHSGDIFDRVCPDRYAAHDDDTPALLDLVEYAPEVTIERRMAAILGSDLLQPETGAANPQQHIFERCDVP